MLDATYACPKFRYILDAQSTMGEDQGKSESRATPKRLTDSIVEFGHVIVGVWVIKKSRMTQSLCIHSTWERPEEDCSFLNIPYILNYQR